MTLVATLLQAAAIAHAQPDARVSTTRHLTFVEGNQLHSWCSRQADGPSAMCFGYIIGIADGMELIAGVADGDVRSVCYPADGVTLGQVRDVVIKYLADNPDKRHFPASYLVQNALSAAFPCMR